MRLMWYLVPTKKLAPDTIEVAIRVGHSLWNDLLTSMTEKSLHTTILADAKQAYRYNKKNLSVYKDKTKVNSNCVIRKRGV